jgi:hypothetical protein
VCGVSSQVLAVDPIALRLRWRVEGAQALVLPPREREARRADGLWRSTCFEVFLRHRLRAQHHMTQTEDDTPYVELNLSPSGLWNVYEFSGYRQGMALRAMAHAPEVATSVKDHRHGDRSCVLTFDATVERAALPALPCALALTAVLEEHGGVKSYWAIAHPASGPPDFHAAAGFAARLDDDGAEDADDASARLPSSPLAPRS